METLSACVHMYPVQAWCLWESEEDVKSLRMEVTDEIMGSPRAEVAGVLRYHVGAGN